MTTLAHLTSLSSLRRILPTVAGFDVFGGAPMLEVSGAAGDDVVTVSYATGDRTGHLRIPATVVESFTRRLDGASMAAAVRTLAPTLGGADAGATITRPDRARLTLTRDRTSAVVDEYVGGGGRFTRWVAPTSEMTVTVPAAAVSRAYRDLHSLVLPKGNAATGQGWAITHVAIGTSAGSVCLWATNRYVAVRRRLADSGGDGTIDGLIDTSTLGLVAAAITAGDDAPVTITAGGGRVTLTGSTYRFAYITSATDSYPRMTSLVGGDYAATGTLSLRAAERTALPEATVVRARGGRLLVGDIDAGAARGDGDEIIVNGRHLAAAVAVLRGTATAYIRPGMLRLSSTTTDAAVVRLQP